MLTNIINMMKRILTLILGITILFSCSTSNQVASNKLFQKRKYKKGWHINSTKRIQAPSQTKQEKTEEVAQDNSVSDSTYQESTATVSDQIGKEESFIAKETKLNTKETPLSKQYKNDRLSSFFEKIVTSQGANSIVDSEKKMNFIKDSPPLDEKDKRILLGILGVLILIFTGIAPLAVWVAIGRGEALRISIILYLSTSSLQAILSSPKILLKGS